MYFNLITNPIRPNQLDEAKDMDYHTRFGRWTFNGLQDTYHREFILKSMTNWSFYKGGNGQWIFDEDLEGFFMDESGDVRNRLRWTKNMIRPMVEQYVGNAIRLAYNAKAKTYGEFVINEREKQMLRMKGFQKVSELLPEFKSIITDRVPIKETEEETMEDFDLMFDDDLAETINNLLEYIERDINITELKVRIMKFLAINGVGIFKGYEANMKYRGEAVDPMFWWFDRTARNPDLTDAAYMGQWYWMAPSSIYERWQDLSPTNRMILEKAAINKGSQLQSLINTYYYYDVQGGNIPVYETYWKDTTPQDYAWVINDYSQPEFLPINTKNSKYKTKDAIEPPQNEKTDKIFKKGKKVARIYVDTIRYCIFVPKEQIGSTEDIVLEWGELPYQEGYKYDPSSAKYPYKCYVWNYDKGQIITPLDDAINPQRMINRLLSVAESQINNAGVTGISIASEAINPRDGEDGTRRAINTGKPIIVDTVRTGSVQNSVGQYGATLNPNVFTLFNTVKEFQAAMGDVTGVNDAMVGTQGGSDALVGVVEAQIHRGSIVQEPIYYSLSRIMEQAYQHMATVGKRVYYDSPAKLISQVGEKGYHIIAITKDHVMEDFRVSVERTESDEMLKNRADGLIFSLMQGGLLDQYRGSMLLGRATPERVTRALREYQTEMQYAKKEQDKINQQRMIQGQQQEQQMMADQQQMMKRQEAIAMAQDEADKDFELEKEQMKGQQALENTIVASELNRKNNLQRSK